MATYILETTYDDIEIFTTTAIAVSDDRIALEKLVLSIPNITDCRREEDDSSVTYISDDNFSIETYKIREIKFITKGDSVESFWEDVIADEITAEEADEITAEEDPDEITVEEEPETPQPIFGLSPTSQLIASTRHCVEYIPKRVF